MATQCSNHYLFQLHSGLIDWDTDAASARLMATTFTYNQDTDATWTNISASEHANANGYTTGGDLWDGAVTVSEDDTNNRSDVTKANDPTWTASGGSIVSPGAALVNTTTVDDTVCGYIDFGGDQTATSGGTFTITGITLRLAN